MSQNFTITPGIEQRLASWNEHLRKKKQEAAGLRPFIALSREFGCQTYPIAEALQNLFNRKNFSEAIGWSWTVSSLKRLRNSPDFQKPISSMQNCKTRCCIRCFPRSMILKVPNPMRCSVSSAGRLGILPRTAIRSSSAEGGAVLTQDLENCLHVRLFASLEFRLAYCCETFGLEKEAADEYLQSQQRLRDEFLGHYTSQDLSSQEFYHLTLNNARWTPEQLALLIKQALQQTFGAD